MIILLPLFHVRAYNDLIYGYIDGIDFYPEIYRNLSELYKYSVGYY